MCGDNDLFIDILPLSAVLSRPASYDLRYSPFPIVRFGGLIQKLKSGNNQSQQKKIIHQLYLITNPKLQWLDIESANEPCPNIIKKVKIASRGTTLRQCLKSLRRMMAASVVKGGKPRRNYNLARTLLMAHENITRDMYYEPTVDEVVGGAELIARKSRIYSYNIPPGMNEQMQEAIACLGTRLMNPNGGAIFNNDDLKPSRDWLSNSDIDTCLKMLKRTEQPPYDVILIPTWLLDNINLFSKAVKKSIEKNRKNDLIISILNTSRELPGQHWFLVAYDARRSVLVYYDSVNYDVYPAAINVLNDLRDKYGLLIMTSMINSQYGASECGVYAVRKAMSMMRGDIDDMMYIPISDEVLYEFRRALQDALDFTRFAA